MELQPRGVAWGVRWTWPAGVDTDGRLRPATVRVGWQHALVRGVPGRTVVSRAAPGVRVETLAEGPSGPVGGAPGGSRGRRARDRGGQRPSAAPSGRDRVRGSRRGPTWGGLGAADPAAGTWAIPGQRHGCKGACRRTPLVGQGVCSTGPPAHADLASGAGPGTHLQGRASGGPLLPRRTHRVEK